MIFTSRTYRVAIRRSIRMEGRLHANWERAGMGASPDAYYAQARHTRKLQARKRKERK